MRAEPHANFIVASIPMHIREEWYSTTYCMDDLRQPLHLSSSIRGNALILSLRLALELAPKGLGDYVTDILLMMPVSPQGSKRRLQPSILFHVWLMDSWVTSSWFENGRHHSNFVRTYHPTDCGISVVDCALIVVDAPRIE